MKDYQRTVSRPLNQVLELDEDLVIHDIKESLEMIRLELSCERGLNIGQVISQDGAIFSVDVRVTESNYGQWMKTTVSLSDVKEEE